MPQPSFPADAVRDLLGIVRAMYAAAVAAGAQPAELRKIARVGDLVDALTPAEPLVNAARLRVSGARVALRTKCPER